MATETTEEGVQLEVRYTEEVAKIKGRRDLSEEQRRQLMQVCDARFHLKSLRLLTSKVGMDFVEPELGNNVPLYLDELSRYLSQTEEGVERYGGNWEVIGQGVLKRKEDGAISVGSA